MKLLFTNAGRRTYMVEFVQALSRSGYPVRLALADCDPLVAAFHVTDQVDKILLPPSSHGDEAYLDALSAVCRDNAIEAVIPLSDRELMALAKGRERMAAQGVTVIISSPETVAAAFDKKLAWTFATTHALPMPRCWFSVADMRADRARFPLIRKRILGSGSVGLSVVDDHDGLMHFVDGEEMLQQMIDGPEYGVDILNDLNGDFVHCVVKRKLGMRAGETDKSQVVRHPGIEALARRVSAAFRHVGNMDMDVMEDARGDLWCIDFNPRFGGGYPATHLAGADYLRALLDLARHQSPQLPDRLLPVVMMKGISIHSVLEQPCEPI